MNLVLNDAQLLVLRWVAEGADLENPPSDTFKTSVVALHNRGLVDLDKRRGKWSVTITEAGKSYLEHGRHPDAADPKPATPSTRSRLAKEAQAPRDNTKVGADTREAPEPPAQLERDGRNEAIPMPTQIRRPHAAVREIADHKARLDVPMEQRQRALLILHALFQEALRRGWSVRANPSAFQRDRWNGRRTRVSPGPDLFSIDAGDGPAMLRIRMQQKRDDHVPTEKERAEMERHSWSRPPKHDYVATDRMRLEVRSGTHDVLTLDDTVATRIEDKLLRAIRKIEQISVDAREAAERRRQREIQRDEEQRRAEDLRERAVHYSSWAETLEQLRIDVARHRELANVVTGLREAVKRRGPDHQYAEHLADYLAWSETHLEESDPLRRVLLPEGERPDLSYDEWREWKRRNPQRTW